MSTRAARATEDENPARAPRGARYSKNAPAASARSAPRKDSEQNQVVPFRLDDCEDDNEEIRRRRYSSCSSSSSHEADNRSRVDSSGRKKPQSNAYRDRENEWTRASDHAVSSSNDDASDDSDGDDYDKDKQIRPYRKGGQAHEEPESPRKHHRKTQQSDESNGDSQGDEDYAKMVKPLNVAAEVPAASAPRAKAAPSLMPVDLSRISKLAVFPGSETQLLQGHIVRVKTLLHPQYHFFIKDQLILMAEKQLKNRTSNYHIFDMTRTTALSAKPTKKSGNYIGKLRSNFSKKKNVLVGNLSQKTELGAILFGDSTSSAEPRRLNVILPALSSKRQEIEGLTVGESTAKFSLLIDMFKSKSSASPASLQVFENKEPVFDNGFYRLNFNGRVSVPSVKNFQLVRSVNSHGSKVDPEVCLQFGKVDDKKFHLDFRAPLTPIQTFAIALAQFNL